MNEAKLSMTIDELTDHCIDAHLAQVNWADAQHEADLREWHDGDHEVWTANHSHEAADG